MWWPLIIKLLHCYFITLILFLWIINIWLWLPKGSWPAGWEQLIWRKLFRGDKNSYSKEVKNTKSKLRRRLRACRHWLFVLFFCSIGLLDLGLSYARTVLYQQHSKCILNMLLCIGWWKGEAQEDQWLWGHWRARSSRWDHSRSAASVRKNSWVNHINKEAQTEGKEVVTVGLGFAVRVGTREMIDNRLSSLKSEQLARCL